MNWCPFTFTLSTIILARWAHFGKRPFRGEIEKRDQFSKLLQPQSRLLSTISEKEKQMKHIYRYSAMFPCVKDLGVDMKKYYTRIHIKNFETKKKTKCFCHEFRQVHIIANFGQHEKLPLKLTEYRTTSHRPCMHCIALQSIALNCIACIAHAVNVKWMSKHCSNDCFSQ